MAQWTRGLTPAYLQQLDSLFLAVAQSRQAPNDEVNEQHALLRRR